MIAIPIEAAAFAAVWYSAAFAAALWQMLATFPTLDHYRPALDVAPPGPSSPAARMLSDRLTPPRVTQDPRAREVQRQIDAAALGLAPPPFVVRYPALPGHLLIPVDVDGADLSCSLTLAPVLDDDDDTAGGEE